jgi:hypothetical protein
MEGGLNYWRTPSIVNDAESLIEMYNLNVGMTLASNISRRVDFNVSYYVNYNLSSYWQIPFQEDRFYTHRVITRFVFTPWDKLVLEGFLNHTGYAGIDDGQLPNVTLLNLSIGYRFLAEDNGTIKLAVADLLNQNQNVDRSTSDIYIQNSETQILRRYVLLNFTYRLRKYGE